MRGAYQRLTADGVVGLSGKPTRIYGLTILSGATPGVVTLYNGTDTTGDAVLPTVTGAANQGKVVEGIPADGIFFPGGCYLDLDSNTTAVIVHWQCVSRA